MNTKNHQGEEFPAELRAKRREAVAAHLVHRGLASQDRSKAIAFYIDNGDAQRYGLQAAEKKGFAEFGDMSKTFCLTLECALDMSVLEASPEYQILRGGSFMPTGIRSGPRLPERVSAYTFYDGVIDGTISYSAPAPTNPQLTVSGDAKQNARIILKRIFPEPPNETASPKIQDLLNRLTCQ